MKRESFFLGEENNVTRPGFHGPQERYSGFQGGICSEGQKKRGKRKKEKRIGTGYEAKSKRKEKREKEK